MTPKQRILNRFGTWQAAGKAIGMRDDTLRNAVARGRISPATAEKLKTHGLDEGLEVVGPCGKKYIDFAYIDSLPMVQAWKSREQRLIDNAPARKGRNAAGYEVSVVSTRMEEYRRAHWGRV